MVDTNGGSQNSNPLQQNVQWQPAAGAAAAAACAKSAACMRMVVTGAVAVEKARQDAIHGNSSQSQRPTEVYYLINRDSLTIDKIGITSDPGGRYSQAYLDAENVRYEAQTQYSSRYPALVDENIRLTWYQINNGQLPRLNQVTH
jgi:hypothetical protein